MLTFDGAGGVTGTSYVVAGAFAAMGSVVTGSYMVNPDGWGTLALSTITLDGSGNASQATYSILLMSTGVLIARTDNGIFAEATLTSQSKTAYSNAIANGSFVLQDRGYSAGGPCSLLAELSFDGFGNVSGKAQFLSLGAGSTGTVVGTYSINTDGTGNLTLSLTYITADGSTSSTSLTYAMFLVNGSGAAVAISSDPGTTTLARLLVK